MKDETTEIALVEVPEKFKSQVAVFNDRAQFDALLKACKAEADKVGTDISTAKARDEIKSVAYKIRKVGVAIDDAGAALAEDMRKQVSVIDKSRREYKSSVTDLAAAVRKPVTDWEEAEKARVEKIQQTLKDITELGRVPFGMTAAQIRKRIDDLDAIEIDETFGDLQEQATDRATASADALQQAFTAAVALEAQAAENERMRKEKEEADRKAAEERAARDAEEAQREAAARQKEREAQETARAQQAKIDQLEAEKRAAEQKAADAERREKEAAEREAKRIADEEAETKRREQMLKDRKAEEARAAKENAERAKRAKAERDQRIKQTESDIEAIGMPRDLARRTVELIIGGQIRHVTFE